MKIKKDAIIDATICIYICAIYAFPLKIFLVELILIPIWMLLRFRIKTDFYFIRSLFFLFFCGLFSLNALNIYPSLFAWIQLLKLFFIGWLLIGSANKKNIANKIINYFVLAAFILILKLVILLPGHNIFATRLRLIDFNSNTIAINLGISFIFLIYKIMTAENRKIIDYLYAIILIIFILLTGSKKGILIILLAPGLLTMLMSKNKRKILINIIIVSVVCIIVYYMTMNFDIFYRILGKRIERFFITISEGETNIDSSTSTRISMINYGLNIIKTNFLKGYGLSQYAIMSPFRTYSHNNYIELMVSVGLIGTICYYMLPLFLLVKNIKYRKKLKILNCFVIFNLLVLILDIALVSYYNRLIQVGFIINCIILRIVMCKKIKKYN